jgi:hypothetical protein
MWSISCPKKKKKEKRERKEITSVQLLIAWHYDCGIPDKLGLLGIA